MKSLYESERKIHLVITNIKFCHCIDNELNYRLLLVIAATSITAWSMIRMSPAFIIIFLLVPFTSGSLQPTLINSNLQVAATDSDLYSAVCDGKTYPYYQIVHCRSRKTISVQRMSCITYNHNKSFVAGACPFGARMSLGKYKLNYNLTNFTSNLNSEIFCKAIRREGTLCGSCNKKSALAINSYSQARRKQIFIGPAAH